MTFSYDLIVNDCYSFCSRARGVAVVQSVARSCCYMHSPNASTSVPTNRSRIIKRAKGRGIRRCNMRFAHGADLVVTFSCRKRTMMNVRKSTRRESRPASAASRPIREVSCWNQRKVSVEC